MTGKVNGTEFSILIGFAVGAANGFIVKDEYFDKFNQNQIERKIIYYSEIEKHLKSKKAKETLIELAKIQWDNKPSEKNTIASIVRQAAGLEDFNNT